MKDQTWKEMYPNLVKLTRSQWERILQLLDINETSSTFPTGIGKEDSDAETHTEPPTQDEAEE